MKVDELASYWQELASKAGLDETQIKSVGETLGDERVAKVFTEGFRSASEFSRGLDKQRSEWEQKVNESNQKVEQLTNWYEKEAKPAYEQNLSGIQTLQKYQELYGSLDGQPPANPATYATQPEPSNGLTREEFQKAMEDYGHKTVDLTKAALLMGGDYQQRFKRPLSQEELSEIEKTALDNRLPLDKAYQSWVAPKVRELELSELEAKHKQEKEEAVRDALSKHNLPVESKPPEYHPFFNPQPAEGDAQPDGRVASRQAFLESWQAKG
jgi:hypothetical protein